MGAGRGFSILKVNSSKCSSVARSRREFLMDCFQSTKLRGVIVRKCLFESARPAHGLAIETHIVECPKNSQSFPGPFCDGPNGNGELALTRFLKNPALRCETQRSAHSRAHDCRARYCRTPCCLAPRTRGHAQGSNDRATRRTKFPCRFPADHSPSCSPLDALGYPFPDTHTMETRAFSMIDGDRSKTRFPSCDFS